MNDETQNYANDEAEQTVLGCMLTDTGSIKIVLEHLTAQDFYREEHQNIFFLIKSMNENGKPVDIITLTEEARNNGGIERCGSVVYISDLLNSIATTANLPHYIKIIKEKAEKRKDAEIREQLIKDIKTGHPLKEILPFYEKVADVAKEDTETTWEVNEFLKQDFKEPMAYCKGLVYPRGITGIFGQPKCYKTFCVLNIAFALSTGKPFLNFEISNPIKTLILQAELSDGRLQERMTKMTPFWGVPAEGKLYIRTIRGAFLNETKGLSEVSAIIRAIKPEVIIIDPLIEFFTGDENLAKDMSNLFANLETLLTDDRSIILVHHLRKPNKDGGDSFAQIRGSSVIYGKLDAGIHISPLVDGQVVLDFATRNIAKPDKFIATIDENLIFHYCKEFGATKVKDSHITEALQGKGEIPIKALADEISEICECRPETVSKHITRMIKSGLLTKSGGTRNASVKLPE